MRSCACPPGWPRLFKHAENGWPVTVVSHHDHCTLPSVRVSGECRSAAAFEARVADAVGDRGGGAGEIAMTWTAGNRRAGCLFFACTPFISDSGAVT